MGYALGPPRLRRRSGDLGHEVVRADQRAGDHLGKERDVERVVEEPAGLDLAALQIDQIGDVLEREERDAERESQVGVRCREAEVGCEVGQEVQVLERPEDREVQADRQRDEKRIVGSPEDHADGPVQADRQDEEGHETQAERGVEQERDEEQRRGSPVGQELRHDPVDEDGGRQEDQQEDE